jgi:hypothetical protein
VLHGTPRIGVPLSVTRETAEEQSAEVGQGPAFFVRRARKMAGTKTERGDCMRPPSERNADLFLILESSARRTARFQFHCGERVKNPPSCIFFGRPHVAVA